MEIVNILEAIHSHLIRITDHADEEAASDNLSLGDILLSIENGEIIEDYPDDKPYPSCLIYGESSDSDPIHSVWAYNESSQWAVLITVYRPDPNRWINWRVRR
jgi:hypothetical protein